MASNKESVLRIDKDFIISDLLERHKNSENILFLQVGAFDGVSGDPLHEYVMKHGWRGVLVEPQVKYFEKLKNTYEDREKIDLLNAAIGEKGKSKKIYMIDNPESDDVPEWAGQISSFKRETIMNHSWAIPDIEKRITSKEVNCFTIMEVIKKYNMYDIDLVQIDAEGYDDKIVNMIDLDKISPRVIMFENIHISENSHNGILNMLIDENFKIHVGKKDTVAYKRKKINKKEYLYDS